LLKPSRDGRERKRREKRRGREEKGEEEREEEISAIGFLSCLSPLSSSPFRALYKDTGERAREMRRREEEKKKRIEEDDWL
jgi:hypothetical protein